LASEHGNEQKLEAYGGFEYKNMIHSGYKHCFVSAVMTAFADHYPLELKPDHIWQLILEGVSNHVSKYPEELRNKFVVHEGKMGLDINCDDFVKGSLDNDWPRLLTDFSKQIKKNTKNDVYEAIVGERFSNTTDIEFAAREASLMSIVRNYFEYSCSTCCGIPSITLDGTKQDWVNLRERVKKLRQFMMPAFGDLWLETLDSVLSKFVDVYDDKVDILFWKSIAKYNSSYGSGSDTWISGWINCLFPYIKGGLRENIHCIPWNKLKKFVGNNGKNDGSGPSVSDFGKSFCWSNVTWNCFDKSYNLIFKAGFGGVSQNTDTFALTPEIGWAIVEKVEPLQSILPYSHYNGRSVDRENFLKIHDMNEEEEKKARTEEFMRKYHQKTDEDEYRLFDTMHDIVDAIIKLPMVITVNHSYSQFLIGLSEKSNEKIVSLVMESVQSLIPNESLLMDEFNFITFDTLPQKYAEMDL
jgi:hypothetical protein